MHDLIPLGPALPGALTTAEIDATMGYAAAEKAQATRAAYASDWRDFAPWCASRGATALPAHVGIVAAYLSSLANRGRKASTIGRRAAAIGYHHKMAGHEQRVPSHARHHALAGSSARFAVLSQEHPDLCLELASRLRNARDACASAVRHCMFSLVQCIRGGYSS